MKRVDDWNVEDYRGDSGSNGNRRKGGNEAHFGGDLLHESVEVVHFG
jgi:hypothetical protein